MPNEDQLIQFLYHGDFENFNKALEQMASRSIRGANLCGLDLRQLDAAGLDMRDCHLRRSDLRGLDLSTALLDGASIGGAKISGTLFPKNLGAEEINLSLVHGTRLRTIED
ncbi:MAG TPA: hypothetical protein ENG92_00125 [Thiolapillus brandeum]|uniref:Pentapeptide repeat-containing protein n=1 Tax=Thiolapillus brandeum TaxID=1076588 RepID=A0A831K270_9GAMM|nr:hypothetical protein [Thiolapillus brandeum]